jgi:hypothetical protein
MSTLFHSFVEAWFEIRRTTEFNLFFDKLRTRTPVTLKAILLYRVLQAAADGVKGRIILCLEDAAIWHLVFLFLRIFEFVSESLPLPTSSLPQNAKK